MNIVIANAADKLDNGMHVVPFPSRWDSGVQRVLFRWYPYELAYLSTLLKRELPDAKVTLLDGNERGWDGDRYIAEIRKLQPDVLICELSALTYATMTRVAQAVDPDTAILCGPMATSDRRVRDDGWIPVVGEYEAKVLWVLRGDMYSGIPEPTGYVDLDWLPWPEDEDISRMNPAYQEINHYASGIVQLYPTRGCPLSCTFCVVPSYYGGHGKSHRSHRCRDVDDVCDEIEYLSQRYGQRFNGCYFNEEAHNANVEWLGRFAQTLIRRKLDRFYYDAMCGYWTFTRELVELLAAAGYKQIRFGVESTSEVVGKAIGKTIHLEKMERLMGWLKEYGIGAYGTFQIGAVGSTEQTDRQTLDDLRRWIREGKMQKWQVSTSTPQIGTPFYEQVKRNGWLTTEDLNQYNGWNAVVNYPDYPAARIAAVRQGAGL